MDRDRLAGSGADRGAPPRADDSAAPPADDVGTGLPTADNNPRGGAADRPRRPVALMLLAILHMIPDSDDPWGVVGRLVAGLPSGSYLVMSHPARDIHAEAIAEMTKRFNQRMGGVMANGRTHDEVARFFTGLELAEPGIVSTPCWRPDPGIEHPADPAYAAVGRKP